jgi:hypothetical protein
MLHVGGGENVRLGAVGDLLRKTPDAPYFASTLLPVFVSNALATSVNAVFRLPAA